MTQTNLAVWVGADAAHRRQLGSVPRATEPAGVRAAGGWFTCKNQKISEKKNWPYTSQTVANRKDVCTVAVYLCAP